MSLNLRINLYDNITSMGIQLSKNHAKQIGYEHILKSSLSKEEMVSDTELEENFQEKFLTQIVELDENDPFSKTDLVVFKDSYQGHIPINGIRESELSKCKILINEIMQNKTNIKILTNPIFHPHVISDITTLLTRECGRKLIEKLAQGTHNTVIIPPGNMLILANSEHSPKLKDGKFSSLIKFNIRGGSCVAKSTDKHREGFKIPCPSFLALAHELIHANHLSEDSSFFSEMAKLPPSLNPDYDDLEEQYAITGLRGDLGEVFEHNKPALGDNEWAIYELNTDEYDELNEWTFFSSFGIPVREDHRGGGNCNPGNYSSEALRQALAYKAHRDAREMLSQKPIDQSIDFLENTPLHIAVQSRDLHMVEVVMEFHPNLFIENAQGESPLELANKLKVDNIIELLIDESFKKLQVNPK